MSPDLIAAAVAALTDEDEIAHGEAVRGGNSNDPQAYEGMGVCAYCGDAWPCRTQRGIDRLLALFLDHSAARSAVNENGPR